MSDFDRLKREEEAGGGPESASASRPKLTDFHPFPTNLGPRVTGFVQEYRRQIPERRPCGREEFIALLSGIAALRKTPGIPGPDEIPFTALPACRTPEDAAACRAHLKRVFGITDRASMLSFFQREILCSRQYTDFVGFWEGRPPFRLEELQKGARELFEVARDFSAQFYGIVGHHGYLAWDISECVGHLRNGFACGLLSQDDFEELTEVWIRRTRVFRNWVEFAASLLCGELYWDFRHGAELPQLNEDLDLYLKLASILLDSGTAWGSGMWYVP